MNESIDREGRRHDEVERFAQQLSDHYRPERLGPTRRAALDAELRARISARARSRRVLVPALATGLAAAAALLVIFARGTGDPPAPTDNIDNPQTLAERMRWEDELLLAAEPELLAELSDGGELSEEYLAIASVFELR